MQKVFIQSFSLLLIISLGYLMKRINLLSKKDGDILSKIIVYLTLPAAIIVNLWHLAVDVHLVQLIFWGIIWSSLQIGFAYLFSRHQNILQQKFLMFCGSGFNIGNFLIPFIQSVNPLLVPFISMFDIGNSIMLTGGTQAMVERLTSRRADFSITKLFRQLLRSLPFLCYIVMLIFRSAAFNLPDQLLVLLTPIANANIFLSMFMIGLYLDLRIPLKAMKTIGQLYALRFGVGLILVGLLYFSPLPSQLKLILSLLAVSPIPLFGVINAVLAGVAEEEVGFASSLSFIVSLVLMTTVMLFFS
ncbi:AEC family transporter [Enterococcus columbae]|uniref:Transporter n=1 Tax=Enterococcus columbae DSM 7374 = ATCC 51263 TaxID=1121865 RepID=S0KVI4_9ENTE|nr:AEC family transporter [Enterococcus columbae]EOT44148.1 hypothetical protein OMW_00202 [Enterococcus columbae DSM 7374 = ATCC 51263]EOW84306.1 hypothetical protein I568_00800 [Enterococcus columbae DSM 7374 = ATCC 51263]OJG26136.1 hypothetical protein RR47_GL000934 [Enterococcus columbae DSM 7374 = ATCC 51263]